MQIGVHSPSLRITLRQKASALRDGQTEAKTKEEEGEKNREKQRESEKTTTKIIKESRTTKNIVETQQKEH